MSRKRCKTAKPKLTKNQQLWKKEYKLLKNRIKNAQKRGYSFESFEIEMPKRVTKKAIQEIKSMRGLNLLKQADYYNLEGMKVSGYQGHQYEQRRAAEKRRKPFKEAQIIIDNLIAMLNNKWFGAGPTKVKLIVFIESCVNIWGARAVAKILKDDADRGVWEINRAVAYNFDGAQDAWIHHMMRALRAPVDLINNYIDTDDGIPLGDTEDIWTE